MVLLALLVVAGCERLLVLDPVSLGDAAGDAIAPADVVPGDGSGIDPCRVPFAYYQFENPTYLADASANHYDGTIRAPAPIVEVGEQGHAYKFDGSDNVAELDYTAFQVTPLTVSLWFAATDPTVDSCLIDQVSHVQTSYADSWQLCLQSGSVVMYMDPNIAITAGNAATDTWQHAVMEFDGSTASVWLDGSGGSTTAVPIYDGASPIVIGADQDSVVSYNSYYGGGIDELKFFHCAVPADKLGNL